jgi:signal transduction histidine kinase
VSAPIRTRLLVAFAAVALGSVGIATAASWRLLAARANEDEAQRLERAATRLREGAEVAGDAIERSLARLGDPFGPTSSVRRGDDVAAYLWAGAQAVERGVDLVLVLDGERRVLSASRWPASYGARLPATVAPTGDLQWIELPTADGAAPALARSRSVRWAGGSATLLVGALLAAPDRDRWAQQAGVDAMAVCPPNARCAGLDASAEPARWASGSVAFADGEIRFGLDRAPVLALQAALRRRALSVSLLALIAAVGAGFALARVFARPIEALAEAAPAWMRGEGAPVPGSTVREVEALATALHAAARDLAASRDRLVQAERVAAWREIARGLAHEVKNPLTPIRSAVDVIRRARQLGRPDFDAILDEQANAVTHEVARLKELADSFATFARLPEPSPECLDMGTLIDEVTALYVPAEVSCQRSGDARALADPVQVRTAIVNLVRNAVDAVEGRADRRISIEVRRSEEGVDIVIADSGPGIAEEMRERLFTPYATTKGSRGTGLGLAMVHRIADENGGRVVHLPGPMGGAAFVLTVRGA